MYHRTSVRKRAGLGLHSEFLRVYHRIVSFWMNEYDEILGELRTLYDGRYVSFSDLEELKNSFGKDIDLAAMNKKCKRLFFGFHFCEAWKLWRKKRELSRYLEKREEINKKFIAVERKKVYKIEGNNLDPQQIEAVVACEDAELILAPAGSGKSASLLAKINYITDVLIIPADKVLVIAFTKKVVKELKERVGNDKVNISTFHSLGNSIIRGEGAGKKKRVILEDESLKFLKKTVKELRQNNEEYARKFNDYLMFYQSVPVDLAELKDEKERVEFNKTYLRRTLRAVAEYKENPEGKFREYVDDKRTQLKANWCYAYQIKYDIDENTSEISVVPKQIKRRLPEKQIAKLLDADIKYRADCEALEELFGSVLSLQKNEQISVNDLKRRISKMPNEYIRRRALKFYDLYYPIYRKYEKYLIDNDMFDFADMLNDATKIVERSRAGSQPYEYVLVDEVQDLSRSKCLLLNAILKKCKKVKMFAVGDDWQSIYRFAGSNLKVLSDFEKIFERKTYRGLIELTYRFGEPTAKISGKFIQKNPDQSKKDVKTFRKTGTPIILALNLKKQDKEVPADYETVDAEIQKLYKEFGEKLFEKRVQIISRYNRDVWRVVDEKSGHYKNAKIVNDAEGNVELKWKIGDANKTIDVQFCSMHKSKGITRDIVIVINLNAGMLGMPATRADEPVMATMLAEIDPYPLAEERRLFYVAITRAKEKTILVADATRISRFVYEISPGLKGTAVKICPKCKSGILVERKRRRDGKTFYSCSNYASGCKYATDKMSE